MMMDSCNRLEATARSSATASKPASVNDDRLYLSGRAGIVILNGPSARRHERGGIHISASLSLKFLKTEITNRSSEPHRLIYFEL